MAAAGGGVRDWAELPWGLLGLIVERLAAADCYRFGSVCTSWASVASWKMMHHTSSWASVLSMEDGLILPRLRQMPYLLHLREGNAVLVDVHDRKQICLPSVTRDGRLVVGSQYGWLAVLDKRSEVTLLNPLTRDQIRLPSVTNVIQIPISYPVRFDHMPPRYKLFYFHPHTYDNFRFISFNKVVLSSRPTTGGGGLGFTAMALLTEYSRPAIARPGEDKWILMRHWPSVSDIIYRNGKFLGVSFKGNLLSFEDNGHSLEFTEIAHAHGYDDYNAWGDLNVNYYLVDLVGDLLMVRREFGIERTTTAITVMKFFEEQGTWLPLRSLGDNSIFIGLSYSISLSAREIPELRPNCVYYTESQVYFPIEEDDEEAQMPREVWVFNLEDQTFDHYTPADRLLNWPPPIWIKPSLL